MNRTLEFKISTFNDGVNNMYRPLTVERWYDERHDDYVFTFNGQVEHLDNSASFMNIIKKVYGDKLLDCKICRDISK